MTNQDIKASVISALYDRGTYIRKVDNKEYVTRCPFCGDSSKDMNKGHLYLKINMEDNSSIIYHCFKCEASGVLGEDSLSAFGIDDPNLKSNIITLNKTSDKYSQQLMLQQQKMLSFDYEIPPIKRNEKVAYIENRVGKTLSDEDLQEMKLVCSFRDFLIHNNIKNIMCNNYMATMINQYYVGFLSFGNSHILFRDITNTQKIRWIKYPITPESKQNRIFYSTQLSISRMTTDPVNINLAEGILDIISVKHNLGYSSTNDINIAVSGKSYDKILLFLIDMGFVGSNVSVNIFSDNDAQYNHKKNNIPTTVEWYKEKLKNYKHVFHSIHVYYNLLGKDVGVPKEQISLKKFKI